MYATTTSEDADFNLQSILEAMRAFKAEHSRFDDEINESLKKCACPVCGTSPKVRGDRIEICGTIYAELSRTTPPENVLCDSRESLRGYRVQVSNCAANQFHRLRMESLLRDAFRFPPKFPGVLSRTQ